MVRVGDPIRLSSGKGPNRDGVVTAVTGSMVRVRWPSGEETTVVPAPGTLTVLASSAAQSPAVRREHAAPGRATAKKAATKKAATKNTATAKKAATETTKSTKGAAKKSTGAKGSSR
jgi:topoisomerase IA-like protein